MDSFPATTDGPNRLTGGPACLEVHHGTIPEGVPDSCCCCNPCLHATSPGFAAGCCKCAPAMICFTFTPDYGSAACCKVLTMFAVAEFAAEVDPSYVADFTDFTVTLLVEKIDPSYPESGCQWRLSCSECYDEQTYLIDHFNGDCFRPPPFEIVGLSHYGCTGTISMSIYEPYKLPFENTNPVDPVEIAIPYSPCDCAFAADHLCVGGVRHVDGEVEYVIFTWNEELGDRWEYCPTCDDVDCDDANLREVIWLRGDSYGNCYLELDFEQAEPETNDWAVPPNTYDENNPHDIRDGMVAIDFCGCGMFAQTTSSGGRSIRIHAGDCSRYKYHCGTCRCVPPTLCVFGGVDGGMFRGSAVWDGEAWNFENDGTTFRFTLGQSNCGECVMNVESNYALPFQPSEAVTCGNFLYSENETEFDEDQPTKHAFIWTHGSACSDCNSSIKCGPCPDRCGAVPVTLYLTLTEGIRGMGSSDFECTFQVTLEFWSRGFTASECGYMGETFYECEYDTYRVVATMAPAPSFALQIKKYSTADGSLVSTVDYPFDLSVPDSCDPYSFFRQFNPTNPGAFYTLEIIE